MAEGWRLVDVTPDRKELVVGKEAWPFPVPIVKSSQGWAFDAAAGKEEVLTRRIGRNELAAIRIAQTYVTAQRVYARASARRQAAGLYARRVTSTQASRTGCTGRGAGAAGQSARHTGRRGRGRGTRRWPTARRGPVPFNGYYFRVLEQQGAAAKGGAKQLRRQGRHVGRVRAGGVARPVRRHGHHDVHRQPGRRVSTRRTSVPDTSAAAGRLTSFNPDKTWHARRIGRGTRSLSATHTKARPCA